MSRGELRHLIFTYPPAPHFFRTGGLRNFKFVIIFPKSNFLARFFEKSMIRQRQVCSASYSFTPSPWQGLSSLPFQVVSCWIFSFSLPVFYSVFIFLTPASPMSSMDMYLCFTYHQLNGQMDNGGSLHVSWTERKSSRTSQHGAGEQDRNKEDSINVKTVMWGSILKAKLLTPPSTHPPWVGGGGGGGGKKKKYSLTKIHHRKGGTRKVNVKIQLFCKLSKRNAHILLENNSGFFWNY